MDGPPARTRTLLTLVVCALWVASFPIRVLRPEIPFLSLDAVVVVVIGYWFTARGRNGNGSKNGGGSDGDKKTED